MFEQINQTLTRGLQASTVVNNQTGPLADDISHVRYEIFACLIDLLCQYLLVLLCLFRV